VPAAALPLAKLRLIVSVAAIVEFTVNETSAAAASDPLWVVICPDALFSVTPVDLLVGQNLFVYFSPGIFLIENTSSAIIR